MKVEVIHYITFILIANANKYSLIIFQIQAFSLDYNTEQNHLIKHVQELSSWSCRQAMHTFLTKRTRSDTIFKDLVT